MRGVRAAAAAAAALLLLAGCTGDGGGHRPADVADQGYVSGDGTMVTWPAGERPGPVELSGTDFSGAAVDVTDWRGDVVLLNTWYANCGPCRAEAPDLAQIAEDYAARGVHLLGINGTDAAGSVDAFQRRFDVPYVSLDDRDGSVTAALQGVVPISAVPTTVLLDRDGDVAARVLGLADPSTLRTVLDDLLAEEPAS